ncbi:MAG: hypothetical protein P8172_15810 [Gammaproteobacteria bacterium]|jgi:outer membrane protein assembly factor BamE (lipoprotein component of BamABCDE complex)
MMINRWAVATMLMLQAACVSYSSVDGVDNLWREIPLEEFRRGETTQAEVLDRLGPPSQLIRLHDSVVFYYLSQKTQGKGRVFLVWNQGEQRSRYDRAVFFFDTGGLLTEMAYSNESISR